MGLGLVGVRGEGSLGVVGGSRCEDLGVRVKGVLKLGSGR